MKLPLVSLTLALLTTACGWPPSNEAQVVVWDARLSDSTDRAIAVWEKATQGQVDWERADMCDSDHACIQIEVATIRTPTHYRLGLCDRKVRDALAGGYNTAIIRIDPSVLDPAPNDVVVLPTDVVAHELGHALGIRHHGDVGSDDLMRPRTTPGDQCVSNVDLAEFALANNLYGPVQPFCWPDGEEP